MLICVCFLPPNTSSKTPPIHTYMLLFHYTLQNNRVGFHTHTSSSQKVFKSSWRLHKCLQPTFTDLSLCSITITQYDSQNDIKAEASHFWASNITNCNCKQNCFNVDFQNFPQFFLLVGQTDTNLKIIHFCMKSLLCKIVAFSHETWLTIGLINRKTNKKLTSLIGVSAYWHGINKVK